MKLKHKMGEAMANRGTLILRTCPDPERPTTPGLWLGCQIDLRKTPQAAPDPLGRAPLQQHSS